MVRSLSIAAAAVAFALAFAPSSASACEGHDECPMKKSAAKSPAKLEGKADKTTATKTEVKCAADKKTVTPAQEAAPAVKPTEQSSIMDEIDSILAAKCSCSGASDCTCKKGECKCSKCGGHKKTTNIRMIESLRGHQNGTLPANNARYDATAGVFI